VIMHYETNHVENLGGFLERSASSCIVVVFRSSQTRRGKRTRLVTSGAHIIIGNSSKLPSRRETKSIITDRTMSRCPNYRETRGHRSMSNCYHSKAFWVRILQMMHFTYYDGIDFIQVNANPSTPTKSSTKSGKEVRSLSPFPHDKNLS